jgi:SAM-dependent methyltransferase
MTIHRNLDRLHSTSDDTASAYDAAGSNYISYADGDPNEPFRFTSRYSFADREIWCRLETTLNHFASDHRRTLRLLDAGCGPGTWSRRVALRARELGFARVEVQCLDISAAMLDLARTAAAAIDDPAISFTFIEGDLRRALPYANGAFDLTLCLYGVLNHLPQHVHTGVARELTRVTEGELFASVRTVGSLPTIYVDSIECARAFHQDNDADWMDVEMLDGSRLEFPSHLFTGEELRAIFQPYLGDLQMRGLDLFHSRFAHNVHWNPACIARDDVFAGELESLEQRYAADPAFMNRAAHILLVGESGPRFRH